MTDIVSIKKRSEMMAGIRNKNTKPELAVRSALHRLGFRFRIHVTQLPGKPDLVLPKYNAVIFVHGCFWHGHHCHLFKWPSTRKIFWRKKILRNQQVDYDAIEKLQKEGWRIGVIWECAIRGKKRKNFEQIMEHSGKWIISNEKYFQIRGEL